MLRILSLIHLLKLAKLFEFIMDEPLTFKNDGILSLEEAATVGVGALVSM